MITTLLYSLFSLFILDPISRHNSKTPHVFRIPDFDLKPAQILENVPSPVLAKSSIGIGQMAYGYWQIAYQYWQNCLLVLAKSPAGIGKIAYQY